MATTSTAILQLTTTGDVALGPESFTAAQNTASPAQTQIVALNSGNNTVMVPSGATRVSITNKAGGVALTLKGVAGDTGIPLSLADWDSFSCVGLSSFVINAASGVNVRVTFT